MKHLAILLFMIPFLALAERSLVTVPMTPAAPAIDGRISENEEWNNAVRITNFLKVNDAAMAEEQTTVWMTRDEDNLYFALKLKATVLLHAAQMRTRFLAESTGAKGEKSRVWDDDHIQLRLLPPWFPAGDDSRGHFQLMLNANANRAAWGPTGSNWTRGVVAAGSIEDGFWTLEIKIPFASLGLKGKLTPELCKNWKFNIIRFEKHKDEISSIENIVGLKYGNLAGFARMNLADNPNVPAIKTPDITTGDIAELTIQTTSGKKVDGSWTSQQNIGKFHIDAGNSAFAVKTEVPAHKQFQWNYRVDASEPLYQSPTYIMQSELRLMELSLADPGQVESLQFNGTTLQPQTSQRLIPRSGVNELIVEGRGGKLVLGLDAVGAEYPMPAGVWEYFDGQEWRKAEVETQGKFLVVSGKNRFRTYFYEKATQLEFPGESPGTLFIPAESSCGVLWNAHKIPGLNMAEGAKNVVLHLWLPEWLEIVGAASRQNDESSPWHAMGMKLPKERRLKRHENFYRLQNDGEHYTITADELKSFDPAYDIAEKRIEMRTRCMIALRAKPDSAGQRGQVRYMLSVDGKVELPGSFAVESLAKLQGVQPKNSRITLYLSHFMRLNSPEIMNETYRTAAQVGANEVFIENVYVDPGKYNLRPLSFFQGRGPAQNSSEIDIRELVRKFPGAKSTTGWLNFTFLARNPEVWDYIDREFAAVKKRSPYLKTCFFDYEFRPFAQYADLSPETLNIFAGEYGIKEPLDQAVIQKKYLDQWTEFRSHELGKVVGNLRKLANKYGLEFTIYASPNHEQALKHYSIDVKDVVNGIDFLYTGGIWNSATTERTRDLCREAGIRFGASVHVCNNQNTNWKRGVILRRLIISNGGGVLFWYEKGFDGLMYREIAHVTKLLAATEDFFQQGKALAFVLADGVVAYSAVNNTPKEVQDKMLGDVISGVAGMVVYELDGKFLALAINDTAKPVTMKLSFPKAAGQIKDFYSGAEFNAGEITLEPYDFAAYQGNIGK